MKFIQKDYTGMRFGRLTVLGIHHHSKSRHTYVLCRCDCGKEVVKRASCLVQGQTKSCGCIAIETRTKLNKKHGMFGTRIYRIWTGMKRRCYYKKQSSYKWYGGKGITYCKEWGEFEPFYEWSKKTGYNETLTLDRIDVNRNYCPENCRWAGLKEQGRNKTSNTIIEYNGESHCCSEWAEILGINYETLLSRKRRGYPVKEILFHKKGKLFFKRKSNTC